MDLDEFMNKTLEEKFRLIFDEIVNANTNVSTQLNEHTEHLNTLDDKVNDALHFNIHSNNINFDNLQQLLTELSTIATSLDEKTEIINQNASNITELENRLNMKADSNLIRQHSSKIANLENQLKSIDKDLNAKAEYINQYNIDILHNTSDINRLEQRINAQLDIFKRHEEQLKSIDLAELNKKINLIDYDIKQVHRELLPAVYNDIANLDIKVSYPPEDIITLKQSMESMQRDLNLHTQINKQYHLDILHNNDKITTVNEAIVIINARLTQLENRIALPTPPPPSPDYYVHSNQEVDCISGEYSPLVDDFIFNET
jgi:chromosome segregation ATPase